MSQKPINAHTHVHGNEKTVLDVQRMNRYRNKYVCFVDYLFFFVPSRWLNANILTSDLLFVFAS